MRNDHATGSRKNGASRPSDPAGWEGRISPCPRVGGEPETAATVGVTQIAFRSGTTARTVTLAAA